MWAQHKRVWPLFLAILQLSSWMSATSREFPNSAQGTNAHSMRSEWETKQAVHMEVEKIHATAFKGLTSLGSRPPTCNHKCGGCVPCEAIQVPETTDRLGIQYANYEPEGWKCKCGPSFYNP